MLDLYTDVIIKNKYTGVIVDYNYKDGEIIGYIVEMDEKDNCIRVIDCDLEEVKAKE